MEVVIYDLDKDIGMDVDKILVTLDLLAIPRNKNDNESDRPFFGFRPTAFKMLVLVDEIASVLPEEIKSMREMDKRQKPFEENNILVHTDVRNNNTYTYPHKLLTFLSESKKDWTLLTLSIKLWSGLVTP